MLEPYVEDVIRQVAKNSGFNTYTKIVKVSSKETVFRCNQTKVQLKHKNELLHLLVKTPPEDKEIRAIQKTGAKFFNEILFFKEVYPRLQKYGWSGKVPSFFGSSMEKGKEVLVIEDVDSASCKMVNVAVGLDDDHIKLVLETLASMHQASVSWKTKDEADFNKTTNLIKDSTILDVPDEGELTMQKIIVTSALEAGQVHASYHFGKDLEGKMAALKDGIFNDMRSWINKKTPGGLINGDPWINCFMFKYDKVTKKPMEVVIIDWQKIRVGSFCMDLSLSILGSASLASLDHPSRLLAMYSSPLAGEDLKKELKSVGKFGLTMALVNILFASVEEEMPLEHIIKGVLRSPQLRDEGFKKLTMRVGGVVKAAAEMDII